MVGWGRPSPPVSLRASRSKQYASPGVGSLSSRHKSMKCSCETERSFSSEVRHLAMNSCGVMGAFSVADDDRRPPRGRVLRHPLRLLETVAVSIVPKTAVGGAALEHVAALDMPRDNMRAIIVHSEARSPTSCHHMPAFPHEVGGPVVHQAAPALEEITARVGRLRGVLYRMGERGLDHLAGRLVRSAAQSRKLDRTHAARRGCRVP